MEKIIHQIWVGPFDMPKKESAITKEIRINIREKYPEFEYILWTDNNLPEMPDNVKEIYDKFGRDKSYAFQSDVLRIYIIFKFGGLYLDTDHEWITGLKDIDFENSDGLMMWHEREDLNDQDLTIPNGSMGGSKGNPIFKYMVDNISPERDCYGPWGIGEMVRSYGGKDSSEPHKFVGELLKGINITYRTYESFDKICFKHHLLFAWSDARKIELEKETEYNKLNIKKEYDQNTKIGRVITTYGSIAWIHLQLEVSSRIEPDIPILVFNDGVEHAKELLAICKKYNTELRYGSKRLGHFMGDVAGTAVGIQWAKENNIDFLLKTSRRWCITKPWSKDLKEILIENQCSTISSFDFNAGFNFKTECFGMSVTEWAGYPLDKMIESTVNETIHFVEGYIYNLCKRIGERFEHDSHSEQFGTSREYYTWIDMIGDKKVDPKERLRRKYNVMWGAGWVSPKEVSEYAKSIGLAYEEPDFNCMELKEI